MFEFESSTPGALETKFKLMERIDNMFHERIKCFVDGYHCDEFKYFPLKHSYVEEYDVSGNMLSVKFEESWQGGSQTSYVEIPLEIIAGDENTITAYARARYNEMVRKENEQKNVFKQSEIARYKSEIEYATLRLKELGE